MFISPQYRPAAWKQASHFTGQVLMQASLGLSITQPVTVAVYANLYPYAVNGNIFRIGTSHLLDVVSSGAAGSRPFFRVRLRPSHVEVRAEDFFSSGDQSSMSADIPRVSLNTHLCYTYDGSAKAAGINLFINGEQVPRTFLVNGTAPVPASTDVYLGNAAGLYIYSIYVVDRVCSPGEIAEAAEWGRALPGNELYAFQGAMPRPRGERASFHKTFFMDGPRVMDLGLWGDEKRFDLTGQRVYGSPLQRGSHAPVVVYDPSTNRSIISTQGRGGPGYCRDGYFGYVDHGKKEVRFFARAIAKTRGIMYDNHQQSPFLLADNAHLTILQEDGHNSALHNHYSPAYEDADIPISSIFGTDNAYCNMGKLLSGATLVTLVRNGFTNNRQLIWRSTDNGATWTGGNVLSDTGDPDIWNYPISAQGLDRFFAFTLKRNQVDQGATRTFNQLSMSYSDDGISWTSADGAITVDITQGQFFSASNLDNEMLLFKTSDPTELSRVYMPARIVKQDGSLFLILLDDYDGAYFQYIWTEATGFVPQPMTWPITDTVVAPPQVVHASGDTFDIFALVDLGGANAQVVRYRTTDNFVTAPQAEVLSSASIYIQSVETTQYTQPGDPVVVYGIAVESDVLEHTALWIHEYIPA